MRSTSAIASRVKRAAAGAALTGAGLVCDAAVVAASVTMVAA
jgi:hypothetical protein